MIEGPVRCATEQWKDVQSELEHWIRGATESLDILRTEVTALQAQVASMQAVIEEQKAALAGSIAAHSHRKADICDLRSDDSDLLLTSQVFGA